MPKAAAALKKDSSTEDTPAPKDFGEITLTSDRLYHAPVSPPAPAEMLTLQHSDLHPSPLNPRKAFDAEKIAELAASIAVEGVMQNLIARPSPLTRGKFEIVAGETRWRAVAKLIADGAAETDLPLRVLVRAMDDTKVLEVALTENMQRKDLTPMEEARALKILRESLSTADIAARIGMTQRHVQLRLALVEKLIPEIQEAVEAGTIDVEKARVLAQAPAAKQAKLFEQTQGNYPRFDTADDLRAAIKAGLISTRAAAFPLERYTGEYIDIPARDLKAEYAALPEDQKKEYPFKEWEADERDMDALADGGPCFADVPLFMKLQKEAAKDQLAAIKDAAFTEITNGPFKSYKYDKGGKGVVANIDETGALEIHKGLKKKKAGTGYSSGGATPSKPAAKKPEDHFTGSHERTMDDRKIPALQTALMRSDAKLQTAVLCSALLACRSDLMPMGYDQPGIAPEVMKPLTALLDKIKDARAGLRVAMSTIEAASNAASNYGKSEDHAKRLRGLAKASPADLQKLLALLICARLGNYADGIGATRGDHPEILTLAQLSGIAGKETDYGLALKADDLDDVSLEVQRAVAAEIGLAADLKDKEVYGAIEKAIKAGKAKTYVLPTMRFLANRDKELAALLKPTSPSKAEDKPTATKAAQKSKTKKAKK